ncbi:MAG: beta-lactamase family protein [Rhodothermia bacterium]|nr:beta-lactamase family protein [Rhodothermia bacterium]
MPLRYHVLFAILTLLVCLPAAAQERRFPDSPTGNALSALIGTIESGTDEAAGRFVDEHLDSLFVANMSRAEIVDVLTGVHHRLHPFEVATILKTGPWSAECVLAALESDERLRFSFDLAAAPPHRFVGLEIEPAGGMQLPIESINELDEFLSSRADDGTFSGVVLIEQNGETRFEGAYGLASKRYGVSNRLDTKFNIGSLNKMFTSVAILQLAEQGLLGLEDPIGRHLDGFPSEIADRVTVRHLLKHRSGWGSYWEDDYYRSNWSRLRTVSDYLEFIRDIPLDFAPGTSEQYSNTGFEVLGAIVEAVSGSDYYEYVREHIFDPAGMVDTDSYPSDQIVPNMATGYMGGPEGSFDTENTFRHSVRGTPAGGGYSTAADLRGFFDALESGRLVGEEYVRLMFRRFDESSNDGPLDGAIGLGGGGPGINAAVERDFGNDLLVVVLSNYDPPTAEELASQLARLVVDR